MNEWLKMVADGVITLIHAMALVLIAVGTIQAFIRALHAFFEPSPTGEHFNGGYIQYARWTVGGLTFQPAPAMSLAKGRNPLIQSHSWKSLFSTP